MKKAMSVWVLGTMTVLLCGAYFVANSVSWDLPRIRVRTESKWKMVSTQMEAFKTCSPRKGLILTFPCGTKLRSSLDVLDHDMSDDDGDERFILCSPSELPGTVVSAQFDGDEGVVNRLSSPELLRFRFPQKKVWLLIGGQKECLEHYLERLKQQDHWVTDGVARAWKADHLKIQLTAGFSPVEGPYPEFNLPSVQWGYGPCGRLSIWSQNVRHLPMRLVLRNGWSSQALDIICNQERVGQFPLTPKVDFQEIRADLPLKAGMNEVKLRYREWNRSERPDPRPMAVLFRNIELREERIDPSGTDDEWMWSGLFAYPRNSLVQASAVAGMTGLEGPYPEWDLPKASWGLGPETELEMTTFTAGRYGFTFWARNNLQGQNLTFLLNGKKVATLPLPVQNHFSPTTLTLALQSGKNHLVIKYSQWARNAHGDTRPLAVLFSRFAIDK